MFDFGDDIIIGNNRLPWLFWIQLLVMFLLLLLLLSYFSLFASDFANTAAGSEDIDKSILRQNITTTSAAGTNATVRSYSSHSKVSGKQTIKGEAATSSSRRTTRDEEILEMEGSSVKGVNHVSSFLLSQTSCYILELARQAFLKCLGLDFEDSSTKEHRKKS